jgi:hypothetical protein
LPVLPSNVPPIFYGIIAADLCKYSELFEKGRGLEFALDLNEILACKYENEYRAQKAAEKRTKK